MSTKLFVRLAVAAVADVAAGVDAAAAVAAVASAPVAVPQVFYQVKLIIKFTSQLIKKVNDKNKTF